MFANLPSRSLIVVTGEMTATGDKMKHTVNLNKNLNFNFFHTLLGILEIMSAEKLQRCSHFRDYNVEMLHIIHLTVTHNQIRQAFQQEGVKNWKLRAACRLTGVIQC